MFEQFSERARKVLAFANQEALRFNHEYLGEEHIFLGLIKEGSGVGACVLKSLDVDIRRLRIAAERLIKSGPDQVTPGRLPMTPAARQAIECAIAESRGLNHNYVGTEHLLLGLLSIPDGVAARVFMDLALSLPQIRQATLDVLGGTMDAAGDGASCTNVVSDLKEVVDAWPALSPATCRAILAIVRDAQASRYDPTR